MAKTRPERIRLVFAIACLMAIVLPSCRRETSETPAEIQVTTAAARVGNLTDALTTTGIVVPAMSGDWTVLGPEAAKIIEISKAEGAAVEVGEMLVRFDIASVTQEISARQADVAQATSKLDAAKGELERLTQLSDRGVVGRQQIDRAKAAVVDGQTALTEARSLLNAVLPFEERTIVRARFAGIVQKVFHQAGDMVTGAPDDPVMRVVDPTRTQVALKLSAGEIARIVSGQAVTIRLPGQTGEPGVVAVRPLASADPSAGGEVRIGFEIPSVLPIDTAVEVVIPFESRTSVVLVPRAALRRDEESSYVMVVGADNRAHRRNVQVGLMTNDSAEMLQGVAAGDQIVTTGLELLADGALVVVTNR